MKPFSIFLTASMLLIVGGFVAFRALTTPAQSEMQTQPSAEITYDLSNYLDYTANAQAESQKRGETLLFFAATTWCQTCSALEQEIIARSSEIPEKLTILKVDYDNDRAMNRQYGVTAQHTLVLLDQNGEEISRWVGGDFDTMVRQIEKV